MPEDFYPIPPSFGALMKRQGNERGLIEELKNYNSYEELLRRMPAAQLTGLATVQNLMNNQKVETFQELTRKLYYREFAEILTTENIVQKLSVEDSINQNISLYLSSKPKEYYFDHNYGCIIHGYDFRQLRDTPSKDQIKRSVEEYLRKFETRISINKVDIDITDVEEKVDGGNPRICRYIQIVISSTLIQTKARLRDMKFRLVRYS